LAAPAFRTQICCFPQQTSLLPLQANNPSAAHVVQRGPRLSQMSERRLSQHTPFVQPNLSGSDSQGEVVLDGLQTVRHW
jgi:hypothetical protein